MDKNSKYFAFNLIFTLHVYLAILLIFVATFCVFKFYNHHSNPQKQVREQTFEIAVTDAGISDNVLRERRETLSYIASVICGSALIFLSLFFSLQKLLPFLSRQNPIYLHRAIFLISILSLLLIFKLFCNIEIYLFLFPQKISGQNTLFLLLLSFLTGGLILLNQWSATKKSQLFLKIIYAITAITLSSFIVSYWIFDDYFADPKGYSVNFNPIAYPIIQQYLGNELLVNFKSLYGLHPYFLQIFFYIFPAKILTISIVLALLFLASMLSIAFAIFSSVQNKLLALAGFFAFIFLYNFTDYGRLMAEGIPFQYQAIRLFFPALLLSFLCCFFRKPSTQKYYGGLLLFSVATIWNLDSGIPTFLTLVIALGYEKLKDHFSFRILLTHLAKSFTILGVVWLTLIMILRIKYGQWPFLSAIIYGQSAAADFGYAMMPIAKNSFWQLVVVTYIIGLVFSILSFLQKDFSPQNSILFSATILGIGLFTYFLGRSHVSNMIHCGYPALILLIIFADKFCKRLAEKKFSFDVKTDLLLAMPLILVSYFSSVLFFEMAANNTVKDEFILTKFSKEMVQPYWVKELNFIKQHIGADQNLKRDDILMITLTDQDYFFDLELKAKSPLNVVNIRHAFYKEDIAQIDDLIKAKSRKWAILIMPKNEKDLTILSKKETNNLQNLLKENYCINSQMKISDVGGVTIFERKQKSCGTANNLINNKI